MEIMETEKNEKNEELYNCIICDYKCSYLSDWNRHLNTRKHKNRQNGNDLEINGNKFGEKNEDYICDCEKKYTTNSGLWKHKKKCIIYNNINNNINNNKNKNNKNTVIENDIKNSDNTDKDDLINYLMKENQEFKNLILEIVKKDTYNSINNTNRSINC